MYPAKNISWVFSIYQLQLCVRSRTRPRFDPYTVCIKILNESPPRWHSSCHLLTTSYVTTKKLIDYCFAIQFVAFLQFIFLFFLFIFTNLYIFAFLIFALLFQPACNYFGQDFQGFQGLQGLQICQGSRNPNPTVWATGKPQKPQWAMPPPFRQHFGNTRILCPPLATGR